MRLGYIVGFMWLDFKLGLEVHGFKRISRVKHEYRVQGSKYVKALLMGMRVEWT